MTFQDGLWDDEEPMDAHELISFINDQYKKEQRRKTGEMNIELQQFV